MRFILLFYLSMLPTWAVAGAIEDCAPLARNYNLPLRVHQQLAKHKDSQLRPHASTHKGKIYSYYIYEFEFEFLGRSNTAVGPRNIFYVGYIRSAPYKTEDQTPARGHHFVLCVTDKAKIEFYGRTDASRSEISLNGNILQVDQKEIDLATEKGMKYFLEVSPL
jgi:hypothetical protein